MEVGLLAGVLMAAVLSLAFSVILRPSILVRLQEIEPTPYLIPF